MATNSDPVAAPRSDPDGAGPLSMDDLRARLDAPLFHRDQGLAVPPQLPRLREITWTAAPEVALPEVAVPEVPLQPPLPPPTIEPPKLMSLGDVMAAQPPAPPQPPPELAPIVEAPAQRSSIEDELNRLAFLPDQEEPIATVVLPQIVPTEHRNLTSVPVLSQHEMYNPRATPAMPTSKRVFHATLHAVPASRRRNNKGAFRRVASILLALAVLGGGLFAAKHYLLDQSWDPDVKPLADEVELARGLEFKHAVEVTTLTADEYAARFARYGLGVDDDNHTRIASELRSLGLLSGVMDMRLIGLAALPETPAYYDLGSERIYVVADLPLETYRFAMHRALATALLDQEFGWGGRISGESPAIVRGTRALFEGDALATATSILTPSDRALVLEQRAALFNTFAILATPSQFGTVVAGRLGVSLRSFVESIPIDERENAFRGAAISDSQALDLRRLLSGVADGVDVQQQVLRVEDLPGGTHSQGMLFWYHVLASRLDSATAWNSALAIQLDDVVSTPNATGHCIAAVLKVKPEAFDGVSAAFAAWAAAAPAESTTVVAPWNVNGDARIAINACDPGTTIATNHGVPPLTLGGAPLRSEQYRLLMAFQPFLAEAQVACAAYSSDSVSSSDERWIVDAPEGWLAPAAHPSLDLGRADCAAA